MRLLAKIMVVVSLAIIPATCGPPPGRPNQSKPSAVQPDSCGKIDTNDTGRKLYAFLKASAALDGEVAGLYRDAKRACLAMAEKLQLPNEQRNGDLGFVCKNVAKEIHDGLANGFEGEYKMTVEYKPAVCTVDVDVAASATASCEGKAKADISVSCEGSCSGSCNGECEGTCAAKNASGQCAGQCNGTCKGSCSGSCQGSADVDAEVECKAAAEIDANINATCTDPVFETKWEEPRAKDPARLKRIDAALAIGIPAIGKIWAKATGPTAHAVASWVKATGQLAAASGKLVKSLGEAGVCVAGQITAAFEAMARVQADISVTVEVSVSVTGSAGVH
ncbi:MAG TPA: hypothetical protein VL172_23345 [Kofleriaceae bacterium]|jgi:hypothetical protein|nr:hypothetical protein [Kofleriaceae bacterium]